MPSTEQRIRNMARHSAVTKQGRGKTRKIQLDLYVEPDTEESVGWVKVSGVTGVDHSIRFESDDALTWIMTHLTAELGAMNAAVQR